MFLPRFRTVVSLLLITLAAKPALQCSVDNLPSPFGDRRDDDPRSEVPDRDRFQAIVPAYTFQCSGRVTEWKACVQPGGHMEDYYIQFQVWRPSGSAGCYSLVGFNRPVGSDREDGFLSPPGDKDDPLRRCVVLPVTEEDEQIKVQPGDVVGYYVDHFKNGDEREDGGIQWLENHNVVVHYKYDLPREDIKPHYALGGPNATECGFPISGDSNSYSLSESYSAAPIISLSFVTTPQMPTTSVSSSMPGDVGGIGDTPPPTDQSPPSSSTSDTTITSPPPVSREGGDSSGLIIAGVIVAVLILAIVVAAILIILFVIKRRKNWNWKSSASALTNPSYMDTTAIRVKQPQNIAVQNYDYCTDPVGNVQKNPERVYATLQAPHYETAQSGNGSLPSEYGTYDYTTIYEDPTSPSYVSQVYSTGSVFDSAGMYVPTLEARNRYELPQSLSDGHRYNSLEFFERDQVFWAPASTTLGLYQQLCTKRYREIDRNQIRVLEEIGSGQFGNVSKGVWMYKNVSMKVAVKSLNKTAGEGERVKFLQEAAIMGQFYHPNIVRLHGVVTVGNPVLIILDYMPNGDMKSYLDRMVVGEKEQTHLPREFLRYSREVAAGMAYLSKKSFVHRDLAARNILLDDRMSCKVGDFGMARDLMDDTYYTSKGGKIPVKWTAPEALLYKKYSTASDVWSYAMVLYEIWSVGLKPFQNLSNADVIARLQNHQCQAPPPGCPRAVYSIMVDCWNPEPHLRPTFDKVFRSLRAPQDELLYWTPEDVAGGRHLLRSSSSSHSFSDLQNKYITPQTGRH